MQIESITMVQLPIAIQLKRNESVTKRNGKNGAINFTD